MTRLVFKMGFTNIGLFILLIAISFGSDIRAGNFCVYYN